MVSQSPLRVPYAMRNAGPTAGEADVLTGEAGAEYVDRLDCAPVECADVAEVGYLGMPGRQQCMYVAVVVGYPHKVCAEDALYGHVEATVAGAQGAEPQTIISVTFHLPPPFTQWIDLTPRICKSIIYADTENLIDPLEFELWAERNGHYVRSIKTAPQSLIEEYLGLREGWGYYRLPLPSGKFATLNIPESFSSRDAARVKVFILGLAKPDEADPKPSESAQPDREAVTHVRE